MFMVLSSFVFTSESVLYTLSPQKLISCGLST
jgi:hypothetical protein